MVLAHAGGVPEALAVLGPIAVLGVLVAMERRARRAARERAADEQQPPPEPDGAP
ncbi:MAG: hypothetical protein JWN57_1070 [Frankiales bacterium]|nr:hypothetical protein [Frankiales bacterium]